jgi:hypothetical protein
VRLSDAQHRNLAWLMANGGKGWLIGEKVYYSPRTEGHRPCPGAPAAWLHLVARGMVEGSDGTLRITDYGRRQLNPLARQP